MLKIVVAVATLMIGAAPVLANECPLLHQQVMAEAQRRLDSGAYTAKQLAAEGEKLHADGKHADSAAKYEEAAKAIGITLTHKK
jgi:hypothetical protein